MVASKGWKKKLCIGLLVFKLLKEESLSQPKLSACLEHANDSRSYFSIEESTKLTKTEVGNK